MTCFTAREMCWWPFIVIGLLAPSILGLVLHRFAPLRIQTLNFSCPSGATGLRPVPRWLHGTALITIWLISIGHHPTTRKARRGSLKLSSRILSAFPLKLQLQLSKEILDIIDARRCDSGNPCLGRNVEGHILDQELEALWRTSAIEEKRRERAEGKE